MHRTVAVVESGLFCKVRVRGAVDNGLNAVLRRSEPGDPAAECRQRAAKPEARYNMNSDPGDHWTRVDSVSEISDSHN